MEELCRRIKTVSDNRCTVAIVTNGKNLRPLIENHYKCIDIAALSIDSADDNINVDLGRIRPGYGYAPKILELGRVVKSKGIRLKLNISCQPAHSCGFVQRLPESEPVHACLAAVGAHMMTSYSPA